MAIRQTSPDKLIGKLQKENDRLKRKASKLTAENKVLRKKFEKMGISPAQRRAVFFWVCENHEISERRICKIINLSRSTQRYQASIKDGEEALVARMHELVREYPGYGYRRISNLLSSEGWSVSINRVYRLWKKENLNRLYSEVCKA